MVVSNRKYPILDLATTPRNLSSVIIMPVSIRTLMVVTSEGIIVLATQFTNAFVASQECTETGREGENEKERKMHEACMKRVAHVLATQA